MLIISQVVISVLLLVYIYKIQIESNYSIPIAVEYIVSSSNFYQIIILTKVIMPC